MLANTLRAMSFESLKITSLNRERSVSIEKTSKEWRVFIVSDKNHFMKPKYSVIQSSVKTHLYKWTISDVLSGKKSIFSTVDHSYNKLRKGHGFLFDVKIRVPKQVEKIRKLEFRMLCTRSHTSYHFKMFI